MPDNDFDSNRHYECPVCSGNGCDNCDDTGYHDKPDLSGNDEEDEDE